MKITPEKVQVIGLGQASVDYVGMVPVYPLEDEKIDLVDFHMLCGGPAATALVTLSRLGAKTSFLGSLSDDAFGRKIEQRLESEGVDLTFLKVTPGCTSQFAFIAVANDNRTRTVFCHRGSVPPLEPEAVDLFPFTNARFLHIDGLPIETSITAALQAKKKGLRVVMDAGTMREGTKKLVSLVDVLIAAEKFAEPLTGPDMSPEKTLEALRELGAEEVVVTLGAKGSAGLDSRGHYYQKSFPVKVVDTTGAGDVYHGGYIYGLLQGWDMPRCMRFASAVAALKCKGIGSQSEIPPLHEIENFLMQFPQI